MNDEAARQGRPDKHQIASTENSADGRRDDGTDAAPDADRIVGLHADELAMGQYALQQFEFANGLEAGGNADLAMRMRNLCDDLFTLIARVDDERAARRQMQAHRDRLEDILLQRAR